MFKFTFLKTLICALVFLIAFLPPYISIRLLVIEILGIPLRPLLGRFPIFFFNDKPYYNFYGAVLIGFIYSFMIYLLWSIIQGRSRA